MDIILSGIVYLEIDLNCIIHGMAGELAFLQAYNCALFLHTFVFFSNYIVNILFDSRCLYVYSETN